jgi:hypothetical protein
LSQIFSSISQTNLQKDPNSSAEASDRPSNEKQQQQPDDTEKEILCHGSLVAYGKRTKWIGSTDTFDTCEVFPRRNVEPVEIVAALVWAGVRWHWIHRLVRKILIATRKVRDSNFSSLSRTARA